MDTRIKIGVIITNNNNEILLIKEKIDKKEKHLWNIIKGTYGDNGNESVLEAAQRESMEEACIKIKVTNSLNCFILNNKGKVRAQLNFLAKIKSGEPRIPNHSEQTRRNENISEIKWFSQEEILKMDPEEFISRRAWKLANDYFSGKKYPVNFYTQV